MIQEGEPKAIVPTSALLHAPYETVREAFSDFNVLERSTSARFTREKAKPVFTPESTNFHTYAPDYDVRSDFSPEQWPFIRITRTHLDAFIRGDSMSKDSANPIPFALRVAGNYLIQGENPSFVDAVLQSNLDTIDDFVAAHPNLMPAIRSFNVLGSAGTALLLRPSRLILETAIKDADNEGLPFIPLGLLFQFARPHSSEEKQLTPILSETHRDWEVQCAGKTIAHTLYNQTMDAALILAKFPEVRASYKGSAEEKIPKDADQRILQRVKDLAQKIETDYEAAKLM